MVETAWQRDPANWDDLAARAVAARPPYRPVPGTAIYHLCVGGDIIQVAAHLNRVSFLWSYPNMMPLAGVTVRRIADTIKPWPFQRIYGAFPGRQVMADGARAGERSAALFYQLYPEQEAWTPPGGTSPLPDVGGSTTATLDDGSALVFLGSGKHRVVLETKGIDASEQLTLARSVDAHVNG